MSHSQRGILQQLLSVVQKKSYFPMHVVQNIFPPLNILPLKLEDSISHFQSEMLKHGILPQIAEVALKRAYELSSSYQKSFAQLCERLSVLQDPRNFDKEVAHLHSMYCALFQKRDIPRFLASVVKAQSLLCCPINNKRPTFNHKYTPLLEKYFERNAYPSTADRLTLARATGMSPRQIEVWFQNHRNRAKKHDKTLRRLPVSFESLFNTIPSTHEQHIPYDDVSDSETSGFESPTSKYDSQTSGFVLVAPSHAFPTPYPPPSASDPFPCEDGVFKFAKPIWPRRPTNTTVELPTITPDDLASLFASKLNLREASGKRQARHSLSDIPWFSATVSRPSPAPHPAFVSSCRSSGEPRALKLSCKGNRTPVFSRPSLPTNESDCIRMGNASQLRKATPLSRRVPSAFQVHGASQSAVTLGSRNSSTSSISSTNSDVAPSIYSHGPTTPPISPISLAQDIMTGEDLQLFLSMPHWTSNDFLACYQPHDKHVCFNLFTDLHPPLNYLEAYS